MISPLQLPGTARPEDDSTTPTWRRGRCEFVSPNGHEYHAAWGLPAPRVQLPHWRVRAALVVRAAAKRGGAGYESPPEAARASFFPFVRGAESCLVSHLGPGLLHGLSELDQPHERRSRNDVRRARESTVQGGERIFALSVAFKVGKRLRYSSPQVHVSHQKHAAPYRAGHVTAPQAKTPVAASLTKRPKMAFTVPVPRCLRRRYPISHLGASAENRDRNHLERRRAIRRRDPADARPLDHLGKGKQGNLTSASST